MSHVTAVDTDSVPLETDREEYGFTVGGRIVHVNDPDWTGVCALINRNLSHPSTCGVRWDDDQAHVDVQWTNKLRLVTE